MTAPVVIELELLTAHLDLYTGEGALVLPPAERDMWLGAESLNAAEWRSALVRLDGLGWEVTEDEDGGPLFIGSTVDGRLAVGLFGREPIRENVSLEEMAAASAVLLTSALGQQAE